MTGETRQGQPGEPGKPGEPGVGGGGTGGTGGRGGRGGYAVERHRSSVILVFVIVLAIGLSVGTLILAADVNSNTNSIKELERSDARQLRQENKDQTAAILEANKALQAARHAEYRICVRQMINRAAINLDKDRDEPRLPLYDCAPNLIGKAARLLSPAQSRALERHVATTPVSQLP